MAHLVLTMPFDIFPLVAFYDDRRRRSKIARENDRDFANALLFARIAPDGVRYGEVELEKKRHPDFYVYAQWDHPRRVGLNSVIGSSPLDIIGINADAVSPIVEWAFEIARGPLELVYGSIELHSEHAAKIMNKEPPPGTDLAAWLDNPPPSPKTPPHAITDIVWLSIFGRPYVDLIGKDRLLSAPSCRIVEFPSGAIAIQVSESPFDFGKDEYAERCEAIKDHIGREFFFDWQNPDREYPMPKLDVEYSKPKKYTEEEREALRKRAGIQSTHSIPAPDQQEWLTGLQEWIDSNESYAEAFVNRVRPMGHALDYSVDSLKHLDEFILGQRKKGELEPALVLEAAAYLTQVLKKNSDSPERVELRVDAEKDNAVLMLPSGAQAVPMARIANLWNLGKEEVTHHYAETLLSMDRREREWV